MGEATNTDDEQRSLCHLLDDAFAADGDEFTEGDWQHALALKRDMLIALCVDSVPAPGVALPGCTTTTLDSWTHRCKRGQSLRSGSRQLRKGR